MFRTGASPEPHAQPSQPSDPTHGSSPESSRHEKHAVLQTVGSGSSVMKVDEGQCIIILLQLAVHFPPTLANQDPGRKGRFSPQASPALMDGSDSGCFVAQRRWEKQSTQERNSLTSTFQAGAGPEPTFPSKGIFTRLPWPSGLKLLNPTFEVQHTEPCPRD